MRTPGHSDNASRREFLRGTARYGLLTLIVALILPNLRKARMPSDVECPDQGPCGGCPVLATCIKPQATASRNPSGGR
ncbi:MAG: hypothetical protein AB9869_11205 [Verrucomicrobiia bacterium]